MRTDQALPPVMALPIAVPKPPSLPCPACGGALVSALIRGTDELFCSACPWSLPNLPAEAGWGMPDPDVLIREHFPVPGVDPALLRRLVRASYSAPVYRSVRLLSGLLRVTADHAAAFAAAHGPDCGCVGCDRLRVEGGAGLVGAVAFAAHTANGLLFCVDSLGDLPARRGDALRALAELADVVEEEAGEGDADPDPPAVVGGNPDA